MSKNQEIIKDFKIINDKFIIPMSKEVIYFLPYSNKKLENEFVVRLLLQFDEPADNLTREEKLEYHSKNNSKALNDILETLKNVNYSEVSNVSSEAWIIFNEYDEEYINILSKSKYVSGVIIYTIDGESNEEIIPIANEDEFTSKITNYDSKKSITAINNAFTIFNDKKIPNDEFNIFTKEIINSIKVANSSYDAKSLSLTIDLNKYKTENEIAQLFAYIYLNKDNSTYFLEHLVKIICDEIENKKYEYKNISRINFDIDSLKNGTDPIRRDLQFTAYNKYLLKDNPSIEEITKYLGSSVRFKNRSDVEISFKNSILFYKNYFNAICNQIHILKEIAIFDPSDLEVSKIVKSSSNDKTLGVEFKWFDSQEKMNLLFAYLSKEPYNKQYWVEQITNRILAAIEENKLGNIADYSFIAFNFNENLKENVQVASIGGIYRTINSKEIDISDPDSVQMVENCLDPNRVNFRSYLDIYKQLLENISWNRSTYLAYNSLNNVLFKYTKDELNSLVMPIFDPWDKFEKIFDRLDLGEYKFGKDKSHVIFNFNLIKKSYEFSQLFALMSSDPYKRGKKWIDTFVHYAKKAIILLKKNFEDISRISFDVYDTQYVNSYNPCIGGFYPTSPIYSEQKPTEIVNKNGKFKNPDSILKALLYNLEASGRELQIQQANNGFPINIGINSPFAPQFATVGLNEYFSKSQSGQLDFDDKYDNSVGIMEAQGGLIDYTDLQIFSNPKKINHASGSIRPHGNLVGQIACSSYGVDRYSTIISSGFGARTTPLTATWNINTTIDWLIDNGIKILNCSWGMAKGPNDPAFVTYSELSFKMDYVARKFGLTILKGTGNSHNQKIPPFFKDDNLAVNIINVGSVNANGTILSIFSDYEKNPKYLFTKEAPKPLLVAPGESYYNVRSQTYHNGTSYATPLVTGTVSLLMKEFHQLRDKPSGVMAVLAASSWDIYSSEINNNGLRNETGSGLLDYPMARVAAKNLDTKLIENDLAPGTLLFESECITLEPGEQLIASCASLFNSAYVDTRESQYLWPTRGGLSSFPIIGAIYLLIANSKNRKILTDFKSNFEEYFTKLKLDKTIDIANLDKSLLPYNLKIELQRFDLRTGKWLPVSWTIEPTATVSNIKKYTYKHLGERAGFKYFVKVNRTASKLSFDKTKNYVSATHIVRKS